MRRGIIIDTWNKVIYSADWDTAINTAKTGDYLLITAKDFDRDGYTTYTIHCQFVVQIIDLQPGTYSFWKGFTPGYIIVKEPHGKPFHLYTYKQEGKYSKYTYSQELINAVSLHTRHTANIHIGDHVDLLLIKEIAEKNEKAYQEKMALVQKLSEEMTNKKAQELELERQRQEREKQQKYSQAATDLNQLFNNQNNP